MELWLVVRIQLLMVCLSVSLSLWVNLLNHGYLISTLCACLYWSIETWWDCRPIFCSAIIKFWLFTINYQIFRSVSVYKQQVYHTGFIIRYQYHILTTSILIVAIPALEMLVKDLFLSRSLTTASTPDTAFHDIETQREVAASMLLKLISYQKVSLICKYSVIS